MTIDTLIEQAALDKGMNQPRVTGQAIDELIASEQYHRFPDTTVTICCLTLENGFSVIGESASASGEKLDPNVARMIARQNARNKIWALEGYLLRQRLHDAATCSHPDRNK